MLRAGNLVRCLNTAQVGTVIDILRLGSRTMVLVEWPNETNWTESFELEAIDTF